MLNVATMATRARGHRCPKTYANPSRSAAQTGTKAGARDVHPKQPHDHSQVAHCIGEEAGCQPGCGNQSPRQGRPNHPREIEATGAQGNGIHEVFPIHDLGYESLTGRHLKGGQHSGEDCEPHDPVHGDEAQSREQGERQRLGQHEALQQQDEPALVYPVGDYAAVEREQEDGERPQCRDQPDGKSRVGELQYQPSLGNDLHPGAAEGNELAGEE